MKVRPASISGVLFALVLTLSRVSAPAKVPAFFNITRAWVPDLIFVTGGAVVVTLLLTPLILAMFAGMALEDANSRIFTLSSLLPISLT